jgi:hypothetical protein
VRAFTIKLSDVARCPLHSVSASHYRPDGSCRCQPFTRETATAVLLDRLSHCDDCGCSHDHPGPGCGCECHGEAEL